MQRHTHSLTSILGVTFGLAVIVGNTIGAGILRTPGAIAAHLPSFWPFIAVWLFGGLYALLGANAIAELGTLVPRSGGQYVFVRRALGDYAGFVVGWSDWISTCGTTAAVAIIVGEYASALFPIFASPRATALVLIALLTVLQWFGLRSGSAAQTITSVAKAVVLLALVAGCLYLGARDPLTTSLDAEPETTWFVAFILALQAVIYTYDGWTAVIYFSEEVKNPGRDVPRAMFGGLATVIVLYLLINIAFLRVVPLGTIAGSDFAAAVVAKHMFGIYGDMILRGLMVIALISAVNSNVMMAPRVIYAMSGDRLFWRGAREVNPGGTPDVATLISSVLAAAFVASGTFTSVIAKLSFFFVANYALSFVSLFVLRSRESDAPRPYRAWGHPLTTGLALAGSIAFLVGSIISDPINSAWAIGLLFVSLPLFAIFSHEQAIAS